MHILQYRFLYAVALHVVGTNKLMHVVRDVTHWWRGASHSQLLEGINKQLPFRPITSLIKLEICDHSLLWLNRATHPTQPRLDQPQLTRAHAPFICDRWRCSPRGATESTIEPITSRRNITSQCDVTASSLLALVGFWRDFLCFLCRVIVAVLNVHLGEQWKTSG